MSRLLIALALALPVALTGCADAEEEPPPVSFENRRFAYQQACVARVLAAEATDDIATLEEVTAAADPDDPVGALSARASGVALEFARAYQRHAELREAAYAMVDSAVNYSATPADSARYAERGSRYTIRVPEPESVEENVLRGYQRDYEALMRDQDHPCYWDLPFEE